MTPKPGVYKNVPFSEYRQWKAFSKSMVKPLMKSPKHLKHHIETEAQSKAIDFGSLVDCVLLEPDRFDASFAVRPETYESTKAYKTKDDVVVVKPWNSNSKTCQAWMMQQQEAGKTIISQNDIERAHSVVAEIRSHPTAADWLRGEYQVSIVWVDEETGMLCKGRPDILRPDRIVDLKITFDCYPAAFRKTAGNQGYHIQAAMYHDGLLRARGEKIPEDWSVPFSIIAANDNQPFDVVCYDFGTESLDCGREQYRQALRRYAEIVESGEYPGYSAVAEELEVPEWLRYKVLFEGDLNAA